VAIRASAPTVRLAARSRKAQRHAAWPLRVPAWATQWEFWLVAALGAILRLLPLRYSPFGIDDALLMLEATRASHDHLLPGTGIYSSILALNPPLYTYLLLPFADQPMGMVMLTAIANIVAVAGLYIFAQQFFGRRAALLAGLFYATACYDTYLSTFIWQQTLLAPFTVAALATLYAAAVRGRPGFWTLHLILVAVLVLLYPPMLSLLPLTLTGLLLTWRTVRWRYVAPGLICGALLCVPTLLFEVASGWIDVPVYQAYLGSAKRTDGAIFDALAQALGPRPFDYLGRHTLYAQGAWWLGWLTPVLFALSAASVLWLVGEVDSPLVRGLIMRDMTGARALFDNPAWRARLLLVVWPLALVAMTLSHSSPIYVHYAFIVTPALYVAIGLFLARAPAQLDALLSVQRGYIVQTTHRLARRFAGGVLALQTLVTILFVLTFALGQAAAASRGELALSGFTKAVAMANVAAAQIGASAIYYIGEAENPYGGLYWSARENAVHAAARAHTPPWKSYVASDCALTPPSASGPALLLLADGRGLAARHLVAQPGVTLLDSVAVAPDTFFPLYAIPATAAPPARPLATVNGELRLDSASIAAATPDLPQRLVMRWTKLSAITGAAEVEQYRFHVTFTPPAGATTDLWARCAPSAWAVGEGITVVTPLPKPLPTQSWNMHLVVVRQMHTWFRPQIGPLTLETAKELLLPPMTLPLGAQRTPGLSNPDEAALARATIVLSSARLKASG
jgi:hypothetical protein